MKPVIKYFIIFFSVIFFDQVSKVFLIPNNATAFGSVVFSKILNQGITFGMLSDLTPYLRIVATSTVYGLLLLLACSALYFSPRSLQLFKHGIVFWIAGISGNVIDRVLYGGVVDFISIWKNWFFNLSDVSQLIGFALVIYSIFKYDKTLWFPNSLRSRFAIKSMEQSALVLKVLIATFVVGITLGVFCATYFYHGLKAVSYREITIFLTLFFLLVLVLALFLAGFSLVFSQRVVGPIIAFERYVDGLLQGHNHSFNLRDGDNHKQLLIIAKKIREHLYETK